MASKHRLYAIYWEAAQTLVVAMETVQGAGSPGPGWQRSGQPLRDGRHAYVFRLSYVLSPPPSSAPLLTLADLGIKLPG